MSSLLDIEDGVIKNVRAVVYRGDGEEYSFLLTMERGQKSALTLPGGCKDVIDDTLEAAMVRELLEELSLTPKSYTLRSIPITQEYDGPYLDPPSERFGKPVCDAVSCRVQWRGNGARSGHYPGCAVA